MKPELQRQLRAKYKSKVETALTAALSGKEGASLKEELEEIEIYSKLLSSTRSHWASDWLIALLVAASCVTVAALLWSKRVPRTNVSLTVETESLSGALAREWETQNAFQSAEMHFEQLSTATAPNLGLSLDDAHGHAWFSLKGGQITLESIHVGKGAFIQLTAEASRANLFVSLRPVEGTVTLLGEGLLTAGSEPNEISLSRPYRLDVPELIEFTVKNPGGIASQFIFESPQKWSLGKTPFSDLGFSFQAIKGVTQGELVSGIKSGSVQFNDTSWPVQELYEGELLSAQQTDSARIQVRGSGDLIHLTLNGFVKKVTLGDSEAKRALAPSYLEYLYNKKTLGFFWGAVVFAWGLLWGIRKTVFR